MRYTCRFKMVDFGSLKALATIKIGDIEIRGFKILDQGDGKPWVAMPSREVVRDGCKEYFDIVHFTNEKKKEKFMGDVLKKYRVAANGEPEKKKGTK